MTANPNPFDKPASLPSISFATHDEHGNLGTVPVGTRLGGRVTKAPEIVQASVYEGPDKGKPQFWGAGNKKTTDPLDAGGQPNKPVNQIVLNVRTPEGEDKSLWVPFYPKAMFEAIQTALAGRAIEVGDDLFITLTGFTPVPGKNPAKNYSADFTKGQGAFAPETAAVSVPAQATAAAPASTNGTPKTPEGYTLASLLAAGWTQDQVQAAYPILVPVAAAPPPPPAPAPPPAPPAPAPPAAAAAPPPPPAPAPDALSDREAKIAAMSPEDRALLGL